MPPLQLARRIILNREGDLERGIQNDEDEAEDAEDADADDDITLLDTRGAFDMLENGQVCERGVKRPVTFSVASSRVVRDTEEPLIIDQRLFILLASKSPLKSPLNTR
ncbi:MAG: hypothetical protein M1825_000604 [Sarcosagium campestre]|nr:MAG: hypothetical protein M1825_000604 [Sarcosagium campestre]